LIFKGIKFGIILQLAIGPMCLMVLNVSATSGFFSGLYLVSAIAVIDALYIGLACFGISSVINKKHVKTVIRIGGCIVLVFFGINTISGAFGFAFLPKLALFSVTSAQNLFIQGLLLTASNPLTIIFWSGLFSKQIVENNWSKIEMFLFSAGCVISTILFLSFIALLGSVLGSFLTDLPIKILNTAVGLLLIFFGIKLLFNKEKVNNRAV
jgi:threonine/homoserine/homoserine lactone efflux protein